ncbi:hypothetical protein K8T06_14895, partial [bacterium]|nr:hypothetical protein [bacterium]
MLNSRGISVVFLFLSIGMAVFAADNNTRRLEIPANETVRLRWISENNTIQIIEPHERLELLPEKTLQAILKAPEWLKEGVSNKFIDILYTERNLPEITDFAIIESKIFSENLVLLDNAGQFHAYELPGMKPVPFKNTKRFWKEKKKRFSPNKKPVKSQRSEFNLTEDGKIQFRKLHAGRTCDFSRKIDIKETIRVDYSSIPYAIGNAKFLVGDKSGTVHKAILREDFTIELAGKLFEGNPEMNAAPAAADLNGDGKIECLIGFRSGNFQWVSVDENGLLPSMKCLREITGGLAGIYPVPCFHDFNYDGVQDLVIGNQEGKLLWFTGEINNGIWDISGKIEKGPVLTFDIEDENENRDKNIVPRFYDINADGNTDLIISHLNGIIDVFSGPDWTEKLDLENDLPVDDYLVPSWDLRSKTDVLITGNRQGNLQVFRNVDDRWISHNNWKYVPGRNMLEPADYYDRYYPEWENLELPVDIESVQRLSQVINSASQQFVDEIVFSIVNIQTEVLRGMIRTGNSDVLTQNVAEIYRIAGKLP